MNVQTEKLHKNRRWLIQQYLIEKRSGNHIAKECRVDPLTIRNWLRKHRISVRSMPEAAFFAKSNHVNLTNSAKEFLEGELLGDGHLGTLNKFSACFVRGSKHKSYLEWWSKKLAFFGISQSGKINKLKSRFPGYSETYINFHYHSKTYVELKDFHKRWYRKAGKNEKYRTGRQRRYIKIVPEDLKLTPLTCLMWYIGDGCLGKDCDGITLCTQGFERNEVGFLVEKLNGLGFKASQQRSNVIWISLLSTKDFLDYIGSCPVKCYEYKWEAKEKEEKEWKRTSLIL